MKAARHCVTLSLLLAALLALPACTPPVKNAATGAPAAAPVAEQPPAAKAAQPAAAPFVEPAPVQVALYPAYVRDGNGTRWGYINASGQFEILPQWDAAEPFGSDGLAVVTLGKLKGLINAAGKIVTAPAYSSIDEPKSGLRIADTIGSGSTVLGPTGAVLSHGASAFSEGLGITFRNGLYGYVRPDGAVVVEPQYRQAGPFQNGLAVVWLQDGRHAIIDTAGKQLAASPDWWDDQLSEGLIPYQSQTTHLWGYVSTAGEVAITAQFGSADSFQDGYAVVKPAGNGPKRQGLINRQGSYVIPPTYGTIRPVGSGLYAASRANEPSVADWNTPKALLARDGRQLTDFVYYEITRVAPNILMVGDLHADSFVDDTGAKISSLPTLPAGGFVRWYGNLLATMVEGALRYETHDGKIVWQGKAADRSVTLEGGGKVLRQVYGPDRFTDVSYPSIAGLPNPKVESLINDALKKAFLDGTATKMEQLTVGYEVTQLHNLLEVQLDGSAYGFGAAHGNPFRQTYHFDLTTGAAYTLSGLFRPGSDYVARLKDLVKAQMAAQTSKTWSGKEPPIGEASHFMVQADGLQLYYNPYEIASYADGLPSFTIPYNQIADLIDADGAFWKAFH